MKLKIILLLTALIFASISVPFVSADNPGIIKTGVGIVVHGQNSTPSTSSSATACGSNITSCGTYPDCTDLTTLSTCSNGHVVRNYCFNNQPSVSVTSASCNTGDNSSSNNNVGITTSQPYPLKFNVTDDDDRSQLVSMKLLKAGTATSIAQSNVNGAGTVTANQGTVDLDINFNEELGVKVKNFNAANYGSNYKKFIFDTKAPSISDNIDVLKAFKVELPSGLSYSSILLQINFSDTNYDNINKLFIYKCPSSSYDVSTDTCNTDWTVYTPTIDSTNEIASLEITSFSVFALAENPSASESTATSSTTTTTSSTTTTQEDVGATSSSSSSASSGSSSSDLTGVFDETTTEPDLQNQNSQETPVEIVVANDTSTNTSLPSSTASASPMAISSDTLELFLFAMMIPASIVSFYFYKKAHENQTYPMRYNYGRKRIPRKTRGKFNETKLVFQ